MADLKPALTRKGKILLGISVVVCLIVCGVLLYLGYFFFHDRTLVFWIYNIYIVALTGVVVFMGSRFIKIYYSNPA